MPENGKKETVPEGAPDGLPGRKTLKAMNKERK